MQSPSERAISVPQPATSRDAGLDRPSQSFSRIVTSVTNAGITQTELGLAVGSSLRTVQNWSKGDATPAGIKVRKLLDLNFLIEELQNAYTDEGIQIWLHSRNRNLENQRPIDLLTQGDLDVVLEEAQRVSGGGM